MTVTGIKSHSKDNYTAVTILLTAVKQNFIHNRVVIIKPPSRASVPFYYLSSLLFVLLLSKVRVGKQQIA